MATPTLGELLGVGAPFVTLGLRVATLDCGVAFDCEVVKGSFDGGAALVPLRAPFAPPARGVTRADGSDGGGAETPLCGVL